MGDATVPLADKAVREAESVAHKVGSPAAIPPQAQLLPAGAAEG